MYSLQTLFLAVLYCKEEMLLVELLLVLVHPQTYTAQILSPFHYLSRQCACHVKAPLLLCC